MISLFMGARVNREDKKGRIPYKIDMCRNYYFKSGTIETIFIVSVSLK